uniref:SET and MYND domain containing 3 n=1 Tax=Podarcis muralis TaxID=64176 RepID=A0A670IDR3_PODMU
MGYSHLKQFKTTYNLKNRVSPTIYIPSVKSQGKVATTPNFVSICLGIKTCLAFSIWLRRFHGMRSRGFSSQTSYLHLETFSFKPLLFSFLSMSLLNNSCDPNCVIVFEGPRLHLRSIRDIEMGEELTISYIETMMPTPDRQQHLKRQYCFECDCPMCHSQSKDADMLAGDEQAWKEAKEAINKMGAPKSQEEWEQALVTCQTLLKKNATRLPDTNIYQLKVLDFAMDACINLGLLEEALLYGHRTLEPYRVYYSGFHPLRAVQMMRVAKLQCSHDLFPQALETLKEAYDIMKVTHGTEHSLVHDLMMLKEDCEAGLPLE